MDNYSTELKDLLRKTINAWLLERGEEEELRITSSTIIVETLDSIQSTDFAEFFTPAPKVIEPTTLDRCIADLEQLGTPTVTFPAYLEEDETVRLRHLVELTSAATFKQKTVHERMETLYYLGEVLNSRGWTKDDKRLLREAFSERRYKEIRKVVKRTYTLFAARGLSHLSTTAFIRPTHLGGMKESDFCRSLIPRARELRENESLGEAFAGAHA